MRCGWSCRAAWRGWKSRDLPPLVRDEVYRIGCEALRNSFRHAEAKRIEVDFHYDPRRFRLRIVDNGKGIDPTVLSACGRAGHHGLPRPNERAQPQVVSEPVGVRRKCSHLPAEPSPSSLGAVVR
jgi:signal transduction histidine kinase